MEIRIEASVRLRLTRLTAIYHQRGQEQGMPSLESLEHVRKIGTCKNGSEPISASAFSPDGRWLATASEDGTLNFWNETVGFERPRHTKRCEEGSYCALSGSHDARYLACAVGRRGVEIWDARNAALAWREQTLPNNHVTCLAWAPH